MSERIEYSKKIIWPQTEIVEVGVDVDFVYIMRPDGKYALTPVASALGVDINILLDKYDNFLNTLYDCFLESFSTKGNVQLHLFDDEMLKDRIFSKSQGLKTVSLDPLIDLDDMNFCVSRGYFIGGMRDFGQIARPGYESLESQASKIADLVKGESLCLIEDDIFSGSSLNNAVKNITDFGLKITKSVAGIQVGEPVEILSKGIEVDSAVKYVCETDIFSKVDLGDPRDFLVGLDGLVVKLPNGKLARTPYILPFVSVKARAGVEREKAFSLKVLQANIEFYQAIEESIGKTVLLSHLNPYFLVFMEEMYGVNADTSIVDILVVCQQYCDEMWEYHKNYE